jgi:hypothetical protein
VLYRDPCQLGLIIFGALLFVVAAMDLFGRRPADLPFQPVEVSVDLAFAVLGVALVVVCVVKSRRMLRQHSASGHE